MRIGICCTLPEQVERYGPVLRRLTGSCAVLPPGRWPSRWLDSREATARLLVARGHRLSTEPDAELDLLLSSGELPPVSLGPWLRPEGKLALWCDEHTPGGVFRPDPATGGRRLPSEVAAVLTPGLAWTDGLRGVPLSLVGDPRLDASHDDAAAARARCALGLAPHGERPLYLLHFASSRGPARRLASALARLRDEADLVVVADTRARLDRPGLIPAALSGPGILRPGLDVPLADLLAAASLLLAEPSALMASAVVRGTPVLALADGPPQARRLGWEGDDPRRPALEQLPWVGEPEELRAAVGEVLGEGMERLEEARPWAQRLCAATGGHAAERAARALTDAAARLGGGELADSISL